MIKKSRTQKKQVNINEKMNTIHIIDKESLKKIKGTQINIAIWNIDGLPLENELNQISLNKKAAISVLYDEISAQNQNSIAILTLIETNIKPDANGKSKGYCAASRQVINPSKQQKGDGIITQTNYKHVSQTLTKLNNNQIQILRINIVDQYIIMINVHLDHNKNKKQEQLYNICQTVKQIQKDELCLGTILQGDFNIDFSIQQNWEMTKKMLENQFSRTVKSLTRKNKQIDEILISYKLKRKIIKEELQAYTMNFNTYISDHKPTIIKFVIPEQQQLVKDVIKNNDSIVTKLNQQIKQTTTNIPPNTQFDLENQTVNDVNIINQKKQAIKKLIKAIKNRMEKITNNKIDTKTWIRKAQLKRWNQTKNSIYGKKLREQATDKEISEQIKENLLQRLKKIQQELYKNRSRDPKRYFKILKNVLGLNNNKEILEPGKIMYNEEGQPTYKIQEQLEIVTKYFNNHYEQTNRNIKNYPKKLSNRNIDKLVQYIDNSLVSTNKACSTDKIKGSAIERPKLLGKNKTVQGYQRILFTKENKDNKIPEYIKELIKSNQKILIKLEKQQIIQQMTLQELLKDIIKTQTGDSESPKKIWNHLFEARQIYLPKTDDRQPESCRPITILPTFVKLIETAILHQIKSNDEIKKIDHRQTGFMTNRSTTFNLLRLMGRMRKIIQNEEQQINRPLIIFYDFKGAFDSPQHGKAWEALQKQGYPLDLIKQIFWLYGQVTINKQKIGRGFLQGGITSPRLYIQYQQQAFEETEEILKQQGIEFDYLAFADDLALIIKDINNLQIIVQTFTQKMQEYGLIINQKKTEYMTIRKRDSPQSKQTQEMIDQQLKNLNCQYNHTDSFKYLGIWIDYNGNVKHNQQAMEKKMEKYANVLKKISFISKNTTLITNTWNTFIRSQFQYGLSVIKESKYKTTWNKYVNKFNLTLAQALGLYKCTQGHKIIQTLNLSQLKELDLEYREHILKQINQLNVNQLNYYDLQEIKQRWTEESTEKQWQSYQIKEIGNIQLSLEQEKHITKQLLNYEGSLINVQKIFKLQNNKQKRYFFKNGKQWLNIEQVLRQNKIKKQKIEQVVQAAKEWNIKKELKDFFEDEEILKNIDVEKQSLSKEMIYGIKNITLQNYQKNKKNSIYYNVNLLPLQLQE